MKTSHLFIYTFLAISLMSCVADETKPAGKKIVNPNGDSELALLMREMFDDGMLTKQQILDGKTPEMGFDHKLIYTAEATEPDKVQRPEFVLMAKAYEAAVDSLLSADAAQRPEAYQLMVNTCAQCHSTYCPGPMVKIKKMYLSEAELKGL